jgi:type II secretory pathway pseudopilin PulG
MTNPPPIRHQPLPSEEGYILVAVIFMLALFILTMSVAAPRVAKEIQRDRELETMERGKQYIRGIRMYYKKFNAYPPNVDALVKTSNIRYLRKKYVDPTTGKEDWKIIRFGQNKAPTAMGFFGQALTGSTLAGIGNSGGNSVTGATSADSSFMGSSGSSGSSTSATSTTSGTNTSTGTTNSTSTSGSSTSGQSFGGGGIIGFSPNKAKQSILVYKKKNHYNEWEFVYDPLSEQKVISSTGTIGQSSSSTQSTTTNQTGTATPNGSSSTTP